MADENECGGVVYLGNQYDCCPNGSNCVWWAYAQRPDLEDEGVHGYGKDWWVDAQGNVSTGTQAKVGAIVGFSENYFDDNPYGHVAYVQWVNTDGSFEVSEMSCNYGPSGVTYKHYTSTDQGFIYGGPVPFYEQRSPEGAINWRESHLLTEANPYSGHTSSHQPLSAFGSRDQWGMHWYHNYIISSQDKFFSDGTPKNCYVQGYVGRSGGYGYDGAVVYDALGGARSAYVVGWDQWDVWHELLPYGDYHFDPGDGGPNSSLGMPITNSYWTGSVWRQDFQKGYLSYGTVHGYGDDGALCAPGWSTSGWNHRYSYLFTEAYERNGAAVRVGKSFNKNGTNGKVMNYVGDYLIQYFSGGVNGEGAIVYDMNNWAGNPAATNEAYYLYGNFYTYWTTVSDIGPWVLGAPTTDRTGNVQYFKYGRMVDDNGVTRVYLGEQEIWNNQVGAVGGLDPIADGHEDLACMYGGRSTMHIPVWLSDGTQFNLDNGLAGWYGSSSWPVANIRHVVEGDFNGDGLDDIADFYDYGLQPNGTYQTRIHVFKSTGSSFVLSGGPQGWWKADGYTASHVVHAVAGDFNNDGRDDIASLYDYPETEARIHVFISTGSSFTYYGPVGWWHVTSGYNTDCVRHMAAGDFNGDGKSDIAAVYDYGGAQTRIHMFLSTGSSFAYQGPSGWWSSTGYYASTVVHALPGDFNGDGRDDIATLYDYGNGQSRIHVFLSTGSSFVYQGPTGWWNNIGSGSYHAQNVKRAAAGDFNGDGKDDVTLAYRYSANEARFHMFLSRGTSFRQNNAATGWWSSTGFSLDAVYGMVAGRFNWIGSPKIAQPEENRGPLPTAFTLSQNYPNPFNPTTTISYALPEATHVELHVYNILGQKVTTLVDEYQTAGQHEISWAADQHASGIYFYRIRAGDAVESKKMVLLK
ncbi:MAG: FG-GAP-like repeat-containing protein [Patescibacteria group bacterium]